MEEETPDEMEVAEKKTQERKTQEKDEERESCIINMGSNDSSRLHERDYDEFFYQLRSVIDGKILSQKLVRYLTDVRLADGNLKTISYHFFNPVLGVIFDISPNGDHYDKLVIRTARRDENYGLVECIREIETALGHEVEPMKQTRSAPS